MSLSSAHAICPGGMMTCASLQLMERAGYRQEAHTDPKIMAQVATLLARESGFDNVGVPFCMTVEAEALGASVELGGLDREPLVASYAARTVRDIGGIEIPDPSTACRMPVVLDAIRVLREEHASRLVVGALTGPASLATSLMDAARFYRELATDPVGAHDALDICENAVTAFGVAQVRAGAHAIMIAEPSGTGDILGPAWFSEFVAPRLARISTAMMQAGAEVLVHVCGDVRTIIEPLRHVPMSAFSFDSAVSVESVRTAWPEAVLVGNVSTHLLERSTPERIEQVAHDLGARGIDIVAPACGIATATPADNVRALVRGAATPG